MVSDGIVYVTTKAEGHSVFAFKMESKSAYKMESLSARQSVKKTLFYTIWRNLEQETACPQHCPYMNLSLSYCLSFHFSSVLTRSGITSGSLDWLTSLCLHSDLVRKRNGHLEEKQVLFQRRKKGGASETYKGCDRIPENWGKK